jgi:CheY-like chemotaxis protein
MLKTAGWEVESAENGLIGVNKLFGQPPENENLEFEPSAEVRSKYSIVLVDVQMPVMNGFEAIHCIRAKEKLFKTKMPRIPIVVLTASSFQQEEEKCMKEGADGFLLKPLRKDTLLSCLKKYQTDENIIQVQ